MGEGDGPARCVLITGAAGNMGTHLRPLLRRAGRTLRLADVRPVGDADDGAQVVRLDITDARATADACAGADAVVHLAAVPSEASFETILSTNVVGTQNVLRAAADAGVSTVVLASSCHAAGYYSRADIPPGRRTLPDALPPRPDTYYGWSKAALESLGALYHERYGIDVTALRIGACFPAPIQDCLRDIWLAPADAARLVEACLAPRQPGFRVVWGVSANAGRWWSLAGARALGYEPAEAAPAYPGSAPTDRAGDPFCDSPLGEPYREVVA